MAESRQIKTALISVFHKDGLEDLLKKLNEEGVKFLSTGGTQKFIEGLASTAKRWRTWPRIRQSSEAG